MKEFFSSSPKLPIRAHKDTVGALITAPLVPGWSCNLILFWIHVSTRVKWSRFSQLCNVHTASQLRHNHQCWKLFSSSFFGRHGNKLKTKLQIGDSASLCINYCPSCGRKIACGGRIVII